MGEPILLLLLVFPFLVKHRWSYSVCFTYNISVTMLQAGVGFDGKPKTGIDCFDSDHFPIKLNNKG